MTRRFHFISGLPRSGSTLLASLLSQNPRFIAGMSSPVAAIYSAAQLAMSGKNEFHNQIQRHQREAVLKGVFENFYASIDPANVVFDTNRGWCGKVNGLAKLFPECRILCCVRNVSWILDSLERIHQANSLEPSRMFNYDQVGTVYTRADLLMGPGGLVRLAYEGLQEAFLGECSDRLLLIQYESLARSPGPTLAAVYRFLDEEPYQHDFTDAGYDSEEYDRLMGLPGLHHVRNEVSYVDRQPVIPPDIFARFDRPFWKVPNVNIRGVEVI